MSEKEEEIERGEGVREKEEEIVREKEEEIERGRGEGRVSE